MKLIVALAGFIALGLAGITFGVFDKLPGGAGTKAVENTLHLNVTQALNGAGMDWASARADGQAIHLSGISPSEGARETAKNIALRSTGKGGLLLGGVTVVNSDQVQITKSKAPYFWNVKKLSENQWHFSGRLGDGIAKKTMIAEIPKPDGAISNQIDDQIKIDTDVIDHWDDRAQTLLRALIRLDAGSARMDGNTLTLEGKTTRPEVKAELESIFAQFPTPAIGSTSIVLTPPPEPSDTATKIADEDQCQQRFTQALTQSAIHFATSRAEIEPDSFALLDSIAKLAGRCSAFHLEITGHTDRLGEADFNNWLSEQRALAILNYLTKNGVAKTQMTARGAGSREPLCRQNTRACRRQNRRIEITVE